MVRPAVREALFETCDESGRLARLVPRSCVHREARGMAEPAERLQRRPASFTPWLRDTLDRLGLLEGQLMQSTWNERSGAPEGQVRSMREENDGRLL